MLNQCFVQTLNERAIGGKKYFNAINLMHQQEFTYISTMYMHSIYMQMAN